MSSKPRQEEMPLLFLFFEDTVNSPRRRNLFGNNMRHHRIPEGMNNIFPSWRGQVTACCLMACVLLLFLALSFLVMVGNILNPIPYLPRCAAFNENDSRIFMVHHGPWNLHQFQTIENVIAHYPNVPIQLRNLWNITQSPNTTEPAKEKINYTNLIERSTPETNDDGNLIKLNEHVDIDDVNTDHTDFIIQTSHKSAIKLKRAHRLKLPKVFSLKTLLDRYPIISYSEEAMGSYFMLTPFYGVWKTFDMEMAELAARVIALWEFGGISIKLPSHLSVRPAPLLPILPVQGDDADENSTTVEVERKMQTLNSRIDTFLPSNLSSFLSMPEGTVNIDDELIHMETKTPCHAFFGEMIRNLRKGHAGATVVTVLNSTLATFCANGDVTNDFCDNYFKLNVHN